MYTLLSALSPGWMGCFLAPSDFQCFKLLFYILPAVYLSPSPHICMWHMQIYQLCFKNIFLLYDGIHIKPPIDFPWQRPCVCMYVWTMQRCFTHKKWWIWDYNVCRSALSMILTKHKHSETHQHSRMFIVLLKYSKSANYCTYSVMFPCYVFAVLTLPLLRLEQGPLNWNVILDS